MYLVEVTEFPEEDQQLLLKLNLLAGVRQVRLLQRVIQQSTDPSQDQMKVLQSERIKKGQNETTLSSQVSSRCGWWSVCIKGSVTPPLDESGTGSSQTNSRLV